MNRGNIKLTIDRCIAHDVPDAADMIESLCQQLAAARRTAEYWKANHLAGNEQLAAALAACKAKDDAVQHLIDEAKLTSSQYEVCRQSLAIQPDDAALKAWLGEPVAWLEGNPEGLWFVAYSKTDKAPQKPLYSPKVLP
mgnify:CR=1 FL=1